jgi:hypothetical protein
MPLARGWGTGGIQITAALIGPSDCLKVIDQGADDTTNAVSIRNFFARVTGGRTTQKTVEATIIQTRHRIPEKPLRADQILVYQVPQPEPLRKLEPSEVETRNMHAWEEYGLMQVRLYEDIARFGHVATTYAYPVMVNERYIASPTPIPKFDNPKLGGNAAIQLFGAGLLQQARANGRGNVTPAHARLWRYGYIMLATRSIFAKYHNSSLVNSLAAQPSRRASSATSVPILLRYLKQSATVLATLVTRTETPSTRCSSTPSVRAAPEKRISRSGG